MSVKCKHPQTSGPNWRNFREQKSHGADGPFLSRNRSTVQVGVLLHMNMWGFPKMVVPNNHFLSH